MSELRRRKEILDKALEEIPHETVRDDARVYRNRPREDQRFFIGFDEWIAELVGISESREPLFRPVTLEAVSSNSHPEAVVKEAGSVTFTGDLRQGPGRVRLIDGGDLGSHITALQLAIRESSAEALEASATLVLDMVAVKVISPDGGIAETLVSYQMVNKGPEPPNLHLFGIIRERYPDY